MFALMWILRLLAQALTVCVIAVLTILTFLILMGFTIAVVPGDPGVVIGLFAGSVGGVFMVLLLVKVVVMIDLF